MATNLLPDNFFFFKEHILSAYILFIFLVIGTVLVFLITSFDFQVYSFIQQRYRICRRFTI